MYEFNMKIFEGAFSPIASCMGVTLFLTFATFIIGFMMALAIAFLSMSKNKAVSAFLKIWLSFFRGTPLLVQLFFFVYGLFPNLPLTRSMTPIWHAIICLSLAYSAYMAETIRGAIQSVDKGQLEGCLSIGMTYFQGMRRIILPQAVHYMIPPLSNNFLEVFKGTSLASMVGITEMMLKAKMLSSRNLRFMEIYLAVLCIYWGLNIIFTIIQKYIENHLNQKYA
ncbi:hypothetical protein AB840_05730 [Megasphaera cerevisiae DSM 20462]|jgi:putative amino-acid transport system permease protein|uniref:ABC transmembrane type-1 domain-containing protein n=1 Tax=Megasphaera cerevisiae DSM 20462 TaxID=1122219 RepID=A0A0J6ZPS8_9FIRM|nr:amino acid ABC transporter permease [Megasphaera cerevisiae]KMO86916.1 hypothetical protein AB840_05730 [Megasphaera cerevisiae DSM 20462]SJZ79232.1 putative amino-acid transport system permease protein [Megasphaera cerevisiae DSM 20462]